MKFPLRLFWLLLVPIALLGSCKEDPCETTTCLNGSTCLDGLGQCECLPGYEGDSCETFIFQQFIGSFTADYGACLATQPAHRVAIAQATGSNQLSITDLGDYDCPGGSLVILGQVDGNTLTIPQQTIDCGSIEYLFSGSGSLSGSQLNLDFTVVYDAGGFLRTDNCSATLGKE